MSTTQLLARYDVTDYAAWKASFDAHAETRGNASLSVLQIWREGTARVWVLFQVADAARAQAYLKTAPVFDAQAGVTGSEFHMLETA